MNFGDALEKLKSGMNIAREGWAFSGMFLSYTPAKIGSSYISINCGELQNLWLPDSEDILADDWVMPSMSVGHAFGKGATQCA